jgi:hypothetical protein
VRKLLFALAFLAATALPASANILTQQRLEQIVTASPGLTLSHLSGRAYVSVKGDGDQLGYLDAAALDYGYQVDKTDILIVPLISGGSGGVFTTLIFTTVRRTPAYIGKIDSEGHLDVHLSQGVINAVTPTYGPNDPQARPSGHHIVRYAVHAGKLVKIDEFRG